MAEFALTPALAVIIFVAACVSGVQFRRVWKTEGPNWQLWLWGVLAAAGLLIVGFVPLVVAG
ncbi:MAG: hypothetical protein AAGA70_08690 [Pseudomonadota bacterium]